MALFRADYLLVSTALAKRGLLMSRVFRTLSLPFRENRKGRKTILATIFFTIMSAVAANAGTILNFTIGSGGTIGFASGERHPKLWGRGIKVSDLDYGSHVLRLFSGRLALSGGKFEGSKGNWVWGPGGTFSIGGCADLNHDSKCDAGDFRGKLLTGTLLNTEIVDHNGILLLEARVQDQISPELAALLHLPKNTLNGQLNLILGILDQTRWWTRDRVKGGSLTAFGNVAEAPSLFLLVGAGLFSFIIASSWSRFFKAKH